MIYTASVTATHILVNKKMVSQSASMHAYSWK